MLSGCYWALLLASVFVLTNGLRGNQSSPVGELDWEHWICLGKSLDLIKKGGRGGNQSPSVRSFLGSILGWLFGFQDLWMKPKIIEGIIMVWLGRVTQKSSHMPNVSTIHTHIMMTFLPILSVWLWMLSTVPPGLSFNDSWSLISIDSDYNIHKI